MTADSSNEPGNQPVVVGGEELRGKLMLSFGVNEKAGRQIELVVKVSEQRILSPGGWSTATAVTSAGGTRGSGLS